MGRLLAAHYDRCFAVCRRILSNDEDALDATQEAMIAVARGLRRFDGRSAFSTWCFRVATNAALDELRRRRRRPVTVPDRLRDDADPLLAEAGAGLDRVAGPVTDRLTVENALGRLPEDQRVAVVLRDIADLDYAEIAENPHRSDRHGPVTYLPRTDGSGRDAGRTSFRACCHPNATERRGRSARQSW